VVLFEEAGAWSAQCLDFDIAAQAETLLDVQDELVRVIAVHVAASAQLGREPFAGIAPAPPGFWDLHESGVRVESRPVSYRLDNGPALPPIQPDLRIARSLAV
jgi:hypothetical protein